MTVPDSIVQAINTMLAPYGESYTPRSECTAGQQHEGYLGPRDAAKFIGISRTSLWRLAKAGRIAAHKIGSDRNSRVVFSRADLVSLVETGSR